MGVVFAVVGGFSLVFGWCSVLVFCFVYWLLVLWCCHELWVVRGRLFLVVCYLTSLLRCVGGVDYACCAWVVVWWFVFMLDV